MLKDKIRKILLKNGFLFSEKELLQDSDEDETLEVSVKKLIETPFAEAHDDEFKDLGNEIYNEIIQDEAFEAFTKKGSQK